MTNVCIVAQFSYGAMAGGASGHVGGVERQTTLLARWLATRGHEVSLITWNEGYEGDEIIDGVRVLKMCRQDSGLPGLRFFVPRWSSLVTALRRADAAVYYQNCAEYVTGQVALWCRTRGRKFVFSSASDLDCDPALPGLPKLREKVLYRYGIRRADRLIVQTAQQRKSLLSGFGLQSKVLPMACPGPSASETVVAKTPEKGRTRVLWAARIAPVKRLEMLLDVARRLPDVQFDVAGMPYEGDCYSREVMLDASRIGNVALHGTVARERMAEMYRGASLLCCTSAYEGFPNTFLEAWSFGLPVVTTVDPDGLVAAKGLGFVGGDAASIADGIRDLVDSENRWQAASRAAREHYLSNYTVDAVMQRYEELFLDLSSG